MTIRTFPLDRVVNGLNNRTRFADSGLQTLATNMGSLGLIQPIVLRRVWRSLDGSLVPITAANEATWEQAFLACQPEALGQIVAGERRTRAARLAGWTHISADVRTLTNDQAIAIVLTENQEREDVDPIDEGHGYITYMNLYGWDDRHMAEVGRVTVERVRQCIALTQLTEPLQIMLRSGALPQTHALHLAQLDHNRQSVLQTVFTRGRMPPFETFKQMVAELLKQQAEETQTALDLGTIYKAKLIAADVTGQRVRLGHLPIAAWLPPLDLRVRSKTKLANQIVAWATGLPREAQDAVLAVVEQLIEAGKLPANESEWL